MSGTGGWYSLGVVIVSDLEFVRRLAMLDAARTLDSMVGLMLEEESSDGEMRLLNSISNCSFERLTFQREMLLIVRQAIEDEMETLPDLRISEQYHAIMVRALSNQMVDGGGVEQSPIVQMAQKLGFDHQALQDALERLRLQLDQAPLTSPPDGLLDGSDEDRINASGPKDQQ